MPDQTDPAAPVSPAAPTATPPVSQTPPANNPPSAPGSPVVTMDDAPPLPPDFSAIAGSGSAAPADIPPVISPLPKKKFGGGRIIATILGFLLLVGGIGAGLVLTQQQQLFQPKAGGCSLTCLNSDNPLLCGCNQNNINSQGPCANVTCTGGKHCQSGVCVGGTSQVCSPGSTQSCSASNACAGTQTCSSDGSAWGSCNQTDPNCGQIASCSGCKGPGQACQSTLECQDGYGCHNGTCSSTGQEGSACSASQPCQGTGLTCSAGRCVNSSNNGGTGNQCFTNANCQNGLICSNGICQAMGNGAACTAGQNCGNGYICTNGTCTPNAETTSCGRNNDLGAPVCCNQTCPDANKVCEAPNRLECNTNGIHCTIQIGGCTSASKTTTTTTTTTSTAQCSSVTAYSSAWTPLTSAQLSAATVGETINFCVGGTTSAGGFDKAKFTINGIAQAETTTKGTGAAASLFCQSYQIPTGVTSFSVTSQIHDSTLGWSN